MFGAQRLQKIREIIIEQQYVDVQNLSVSIGVSEVTIRRDLEKLQREGLVVKTYGGAMLNKDVILNSECLDDNKESDEDSYNSIDKDYDLISQIAVNMIKDNEAIFLLGGNICRHIAKKLDNTKKLLVITNDIFVASELNDKPQIKVMVTGGNLVSNLGVLVGSQVSQLLKNIFVDKAFIEVNGVHLKFGYSIEQYEEAEIIKNALEICNEAICLAHFRAFNTVKFTKLSNLDMFKKVISNKEIPEEYEKYYYENYIKLYTSYEIE